MSTIFSRLSLALLLLLTGAVILNAQERAGELRLAVTDASAAPLLAQGELISQANHFALQFETGSEGEYIAKKLPFGSYQLTVKRAGFSSLTALVTIRSEIPVNLPVRLSVASRDETITVQEPDTLLDTTNAGTSYQLGNVALQQQTSPTPGRGIIDIVQQQPGWLLEANGVLHPRGAEYDTQYVVDGIPSLENRSPAFAAGDNADDLQSVKTYTSGIPAQFGRKVGGVIEAVTDRNPAAGFHGAASLGGGSFDTAGASVRAGYSIGRNTFGVSANFAHTDRYLDPPVQQNYTNTANTKGFTATFERDLSVRDRLRIVVGHSTARFLVPNELLQQAAGQRQDRQNEETSGQASFQHTFSPTLLLTLQGSVRDLAADLWSNSLSIPIQAFQSRGFRQGYLSASVDAQRGHQDLKVGADAIYSPLHENFSYLITSPEINGESVFDSSTPSTFSFAGTGLDREQALYVQDQVHYGNISLSAGLRFDHYALRVKETAVSPRLGVAWYLPKIGMVLRASYDRVFGTPAVENLLLSTSANVRTLDETTAQLPLRPSRGNYYEVGVTNEISRKVRWSANYFRRQIANFQDDDTLLDTGVSFPIALHSASIYGAESQITLAGWGPFSGWLSYSYMVAKVQLPVVGGLFLGEDAATLLNSTDTIWASQDQRHTARAQARYQPVARFSAALAASYGSGLPVELNGDEPATLVAEFGQSVVDGVNLAAGRVRPSFSLDISAEFEVWKKESHSVRLQGGIRNVTNRLNVINFASVFSGTAIGSPRDASLRLRYEF